MADTDQPDHDSNETPGAPQWPGNQPAPPPPASPPQASPPAAGGPPQPVPASGAPAPAPPPGGQQPYSLAEAFNYGWRKFQEYLGPILTGALVLIGISLIVAVVWFFLGAGLATAIGGDAGGFAFLISLAVFGLVWIALAFIIQAGITRAGLAIVDGHKIALSTLLGTRNLGQVLLGAIIVGVAAAIGFALLVVPGIVVLFYTQFFMFFIIDQDMGAIDAIRASVEFVNDHIGDMIALFAGVYIANAIGSALCGIGILVSFPVGVIAQTYAYRSIRGEPVAA